MDGREKIRLFVQQNGRRAELCCDRGQTVLEALQENGAGLKKQGLAFIPEGHCGGRGSCGRCQVRFLEGAPLPGAADRRHFVPEKLREGMRLACTSRVQREAELELLFLTERPMTAVTDSCFAGKEKQKTEQKDGTAAAHPSYFAVADIGTTTVAMQLIDRAGGEAVASCTFLNPGRVYGADVIARVQAFMDGKGQEMTAALRQSLVRGLLKLSEKGEAEYLVCTGNTAMQHTLAGEPLNGLTAAPFEAGDISLREMQLNGKRTILLPGISAFVGADVTAGILASGMAESDRISLLLDLGTNGEMVLGNRKRMVAAAAAAGPAFEGSATAGIYGADMTAVVAELLRRGILDDSGLLAEPAFSEGIRVGEVFLTQRDIRNFQLAKAAVRQGIEELLVICGIPAEAVEQIFLAGGFGYYLREEDALRTGILPEAFAGRIRSVGNAALAGAVRFGREGADCSFLKNVEAVNLAEREQFGERYLERLSF